MLVTNYLFFFFRLFFSITQMYPLTNLNPSIGKKCMTCSSSCYDLVFLHAKNDWRTMWLFFDKGWFDCEKLTKNTHNKSDNVGGGLSKGHQWQWKTQGFHFLWCVYLEKCIVLVYGWIELMKNQIEHRKNFYEMQLIVKHHIIKKKYHLLVGSADRLATREEILLKLKVLGQLVININ